MAKITIPEFVDGAPPDTTAAQLESSFYSNLGPSLSVINGELDYTQIKSVADLTYKQVQSRAFSHGLQVGGTANLDYFSGGPGTWTTDDYDDSGVSVVGPLRHGFGWFDGVGAAVADNEDRWLPLPGANMRIHLPYDAYVLVFWSVTWANDSQSEIRESHVGFFLNNQAAYTNDVGTSPCVRRIRRSQYGGSGTFDTYHKDKIQDRYKTRVYSGHYFTPEAIPAGFHDIGLKICSSSGSGVEIKQTRYRSRSLKYIYFRKGATF